METIADGKVIIEIDAESKGFEKGLDSVKQTASQLAGKELKSVETAASAISDALKDTASAASEAGRICESSLGGAESVLKDNAAAASAVADAVQDIASEAGSAGSALSDSLSDSASAAKSAADATEDAADAIDEHTDSTEENTESTKDNTRSREDNRDSTEKESSSTEKNTRSTEENTKAKEMATKAIKTVVKAAAALGSAMAAGAAAAIAAGSAYETAFAKTETIMDTNVVSAQAMSAAIIDLSNDTGAAARELSGSVYDAISATGDTAHAVSLVADASKLATAGFAEQGDALGVLTTIMNSYGMEADQAQAISDSLIQTQNLGVTTVGQLSKSMGKAIATASAYSIDLYNLESAYVSLTKAGISTEESTTYLSSMFNELGDSGSQVAKIIREKTGKSFGQLMKDGASLGDVLDILLVSVNGDKEALANLWGSAEAGKASMAIAGQGVDTFNSNLENLRNSTGTTEKAYETMTKTLSYQTDLLKTRITNLGTAVYSYFDDSLTAGVSSLSDAFLALSDSVTDGELSDEMEQIGAGFADLIQSGAELAADVLPDVINGMAFLVEHGDTVVTMLGGAVAAYGAYQAAAVIATIATKGFTGALALNPYGAAVAGIVLTGTALYSLFNEAQAVDPEIRALNDSVEDGAKVTEALAGNINDIEAKYTSFRNEVDANRQANESLIESVVSLVAAYDGSASSAYEIQSIVDQLNESIPWLNLQFDEQAGVLSKTEEEMEALNEQYEAQQKFDAAIQKRTDAEKNYAAAVDDLTEKENTLAAAKKKLKEYEHQYMDSLGNISGPIDDYVHLQDAVDDAADAVDRATQNVEVSGRALGRAQNDVSVYSSKFDSASAAVDAFASSTEDSTDPIDAQAQAANEATSAIWDIASAAVDAKYSGDDLRGTYEELSSQLDSLRENGDATAIMLAEQKLAELELMATNQELAQSYSGYVTAADNAGISISTLSGWLIDNGLTAEEWGSRVDGATDGVINSFAELDTSLDMDLKTMAANLESNIAAYGNWNSNIQTLMAAAVATGNQSAVDFVMYMENMGIGAADQVQAMVDNIDWTMATFPPLMSDAANAGMTEVYNEVEGSKTNVADATTDVMQEGVVGVIENTDTTSAALGIGDDIASGIQSQAGEVESAAQGLVDAVNSTMSDAGGEFKSSGTFAAKEIRTGLLNQKSSVTTAAKTLATAVTTAWSGASSQFKRSGSDAGTQIKIGLLLQKSSITTAAQAGADSVNAIWTNYAGRFRSSGSTASQALAGGISGGRGSVTSAASAVAYGALSAAQIGGWYDVGYNMSAGIASGVRGGSYLITSAARSAAYAALSSAKAALAIHSPSRVFEEQVGQMIPTGIAIGIQDETQTLTKSMETATDALLDKARAAVRPTVDNVATSYVTNNTVYNNGGGGSGTIVIETPVYLDGREVARGTAKYTGRRMAYLEGL